MFSLFLSLQVVMYKCTGMAKTFAVIMNFSLLFLSSPSNEDYHQ